MIQLQSWMKRVTTNLNNSEEFEPARKIECPVTNLVLYKLYPNGNTTTLTDYGKCEGCQREFHVSEIHMAPGTSSSPHPIAYEGVWCKKCWELPLDHKDPEEDETF